MHRFKLPAYAGALIVLIAFGAMDSGPAQSQGNGLPAGRDVRVINTPTEPVPVVLSGTGTVKGDVNVLNTPDVKVVNTPGVNVLNSPTVKIDAAQPVAVVEAGAAAREPFQVVVALPNNLGDHNGVAGFSVPAGKRLVIEYITAWMNKPGGLFILSGGGGTPPSLQLPVRTSLNYDGGAISDRYAGGMDVRFYATGFQTVAVATDFAQPPGFVGALTVVGYLVPAS